MINIACREKSGFNIKFKLSKINELYVMYVASETIKIGNLTKRKSN